MKSDDATKEIAQKELNNLPVKIGQWYRHYKGGEYEVVVLALKEDTLEPLVIYRSPQHKNTVWARTYSDWNSEVEWEGKTVKRFTIV